MDVSVNMHVDIKDTKQIWLFTNEIKHLDKNLNQQIVFACRMLPMPLNAYENGEKSNWHVKQ